MCQAALSAAPRAPVAARQVSADDAGVPWRHWIGTSLFHAFDDDTIRDQARWLADGSPGFAQARQPQLGATCDLDKIYAKSYRFEPIRPCYVSRKSNREAGCDDLEFGET